MDELLGEHLAQKDVELMFETSHKPGDSRPSFGYRKVLCARLSIDCLSFADFNFRSHSEILLGIARILARLPRKVYELLVTKSKNHLNADDYLKVYNYTDPNQPKEFSKARCYLTLGEKMGF